MSKKDVNIFRYSKKQKKTMEDFGRRHQTYCKLKDGSVHEYTEWKRNYTSPNWDDAVCLGEGEYHRHCHQGEADFTVWPSTARGHRR